MKIWKEFGSLKINKFEVSVYLLIFFVDTKTYSCIIPQEAYKVHTYFFFVDTKPYSRTIPTRSIHTCRKPNGPREQLMADWKVPLHELSCGFSRELKISHISQSLLTNKGRSYILKQEGRQASLKVLKENKITYLISHGTQSNSLLFDKSRISKQKDSALRIWDLSRNNQE